MTDQGNQFAKLSLGSRTLELPVYHGTIGPDVIDIRRLYSDGGVFTFDPGYTSTDRAESVLRTEEVPPDPAEAVDAHTNRHSLLFLLR